MATQNYGKNIKITETKSKITVEIDKTKEFGESKSGKSITIATTGGNVKLDDGVSIGINCYKRKD